MVDEARERPGVLIVSASMGGGHDGAARELARRLEERGERPIVVDFLDAFPLAIGRLLRRVYRLQLGGASWSYDASYWLAARVRIVYQPMVILFALLTGRSLRRAIERERPSAVVSTYPFSSLVLGRGRLRGWLKVPLVTFVTDFAVHPLWAHKGADLHLCVHQSSARRASMLSGGRAVATGPMVPPRFAARDVGKAEARERLGLPRDRQLALVVAGAWGLGDVTSTFDALLRGGRYVPVAVCGTNDRLRRTLEERGQGVVLGWTDEMPLLMAACDVLVQNAGGLSCMEAFAAGLPVVTYRPVAGHGRHNGRDMALAGVAHLVVGDDQLLATLDRATTLAGRGHVAA
ncbi:MAG: MGDG synthase family glycosyltransferase, partial [Acidimicrobiales bacterium]